MPVGATTWRRPKPKTCESRVEIGWQAALLWMKKHGIDKPMDARWGDYHVATFGHQLFQNIPGGRHGWERSVSLRMEIITLRSIAVHSFRPLLSVPFRHVHGASVRMIYDLK